MSSVVASIAAAAAAAAASSSASQQAVARLQKLPVSAVPQAVPLHEQHQAPNPLLVQQAEEKAAESLASLPEAARAAKLPAVTAAILKRLQAQAVNTAPVPPRENCGVPNMEEDEEVDRPVGLQRPATEFPPPQDGVEACGDECWFADSQIRLALRDAVEVAHAEFKILVGNPADEIMRICPEDGRIIGSGAVLRLGGSHLGGYSETDIAYAYRQLSRALHPDKNRGNENAGTAFKRLAEARDELTKGLGDLRNALQKISMCLRGEPDPPNELELKRPQEALFAEAARLLFATLALATQGQVPAVAGDRAMACLQVETGAWARPARGAAVVQLLQTWFRHPELLMAYSGASMRNAYDCAPKRYRAQFLCALSRAATTEGRLSEGCVRQTWAEVWKTFPEIGLWQQLQEKLRRKCLVHGRERNDIADFLQGQGRERSRSPKRGKSGATNAEDGISAWARRWRKMIRAVLPGGSVGAAPWSDLEVRKLCAALWRDFVDMVHKDGDQTLIRALGLFKTEIRGVADIEKQKGAAPAEWAFVPAADLLLTVGEGIVGITVEGVFADTDSDKRLPFATAIFQTMMSAA